MYLGRMAVFRSRTKGEVEAVLSNIISSDLWVEDKQMMTYPGSGEVYAHSVFLHRCDFFQREAKSINHECDLSRIQFRFLVLFECPYE